MTFQVNADPKVIVFNNSIRDISQNMEAGIRAGFFAVGSQLRYTARSGMLEKKTGTKHQNLRFRSSKAGETPRSQTGKLRRSIGYQVSGASMEFGAGGRGSGVTYASILEELMSRPLLLDAVIKNEAKIETLFNDAINDKLKAPQ